MTQRSGAGSRASRGGGSSEMIAASVCTDSGSSKAFLPAAISYKSNPNENWSER